MIGIFVLLVLVIWGLIAAGLGILLSRILFARFTTDSTSGKPDAKGSLITILMIMFVFFLPILDQLIAYPKWQQLSATTSDFEWGLGMDEKKAFGKEVITQTKYNETTIFPNIKVSLMGWYIYNAKTQELIFKKPHFHYDARALIYLPSSSGDKTAFFLQACDNYTFRQKNDDLLEKLQLKVLKHKGVYE